MLPKNNNEIRIWPQIILSSAIARVKFEQRYRTELRFTSFGFRNRFRYRFGFTYAFGNGNADFKRFRIGASNEIFFTDNSPYFERNRVLVLFGFKPSKAATLQIGYLHQFDYKINDETGRDFMQFGLFIDLQKGTKKNLHPDSEIKDF